MPASAVAAPSREDVSAKVRTKKPKTIRHIRYMLGLCGEHGKYNGNYYSIIGYMGEFAQFLYCLQGNQEKVDIT